MGKCDPREQARAEIFEPKRGSQFHVFLPQSSCVSVEDESGKANSGLERSWIFPFLSLYFFQKFEKTTWDLEMNSSLGAMTNTSPTRVSCLGKSSKGLSS